MVLFALWGHQNSPKTVATLATELATIGTSLLLLYLSHLEHLRSIRPSTILNVFLIFTLLFDLTRLRTLHFMSGPKSVTAVLAISWTIKLITLVFEATEKRSSLKKTYQNSPIETTSGVLSRVTFWWLNPVLWLGSKAKLTVENLPELDTDIKAASDSTLIYEKWTRGMSYTILSILCQ